METHTVHSKLEEIAKENGWELQGDIHKLEKTEKIMASRAIRGTIICPCKAFVEEFCVLADVKCPCNEAAKDIEENGRCHCHVFYQG